MAKSRKGHTFSLLQSIHETNFTLKEENTVPKVVGRNSQSFKNPSGYFFISVHRDSEKNFKCSVPSVATPATLATL